jgi:hypothetical protein
MNQMNPIQKTVNIAKPLRVLHPITVKCIVDELSDRDATVQKIREYAQSLNIIFITREYDSIKYSEDRDFVQRLPAFHIYEKKCYRKTFYPNTRPYQIIQDTVNQYLEKLKKRENRKTWKTFFQECIQTLKKVFHRKTALERYAEEKAMQSQIIDWS